MGVWVDLHTDLASARDPRGEVFWYLNDGKVQKVNLRTRTFACHNLNQVKPTLITDTSRNLRIGPVNVDLVDLVDFFPDLCRCNTGSFPPASKAYKCPTLLMSFAARHLELPTVPRKFTIMPSAIKAKVGRAKCNFQLNFLSCS